MKKTHWLICCTGNTCRSPMAQAVVQQLAEKRGLPLTVESAGFAAFPGDEATPQAQEAAKEAGMDLSAHRARRLTLEMVERADRIFVMSEAQKQMLTDVCPRRAQDIAVLRVDDPFGRPVAVYRACLAQFVRLFTPLVQALEDGNDDA